MRRNEAVRLAYHPLRGGLEAAAIKAGKRTMRSHRNPAPACAYGVGWVSRIWGLPGGIVIKAERDPVGAIALIEDRPGELFPTPRPLSIRWLNPLSFTLV